MAASTVAPFSILMDEADASVFWAVSSMTCAK